MLGDSTMRMGSGTSLRGVLVPRSGGGRDQAAHHHDKKESIHFLEANWDQKFRKIIKNNVGSNKDVGVGKMYLSWSSSKTEQ